MITKTLYSVRNGEEIDSLHNSGVLQTNPNLVNKDFKKSYAWMASKLKKVHPVANIKYPLWAWEDKPTREEVLEGYTGDNLYIITFKIAPFKILGSDFQDWHSVLNNSYCAWSEKEFNNFEKRKLGPVTRDFLIRKSWNRIFDYDNPKRDPDWVAEKCIQFVFWELYLDEIVEIEKV